MLASQLIYTSWKNGDSLKKGFMVYSKTSDISDEDTQEILNIMRYKPSASLPYSPTKEEIDSMFPRNLAYFHLPSGKCCLAQACYVGQDYTNRWGNYIIHAFVFNQNEDLKPLTFFDWEEFRRCLTETELNAQTNPDPLTKYKLPNANKSISEQEIKSFYNFERLTIFKKLVQTIINNHGKKIKINLCDKFENIKYWLGPLSLVLPKEVLLDITFASYMNDSFDGILISCLEQIQSSAYFNYGGENVVAVFDIKNNSINDVQIDSFTNKVCDLMFNNYFSVIDYINDINRYSVKYDTNDYILLDNLMEFEKGNYLNFTDANLFKKLLELVIKNNLSEKDLILQKVIYYLKSSKFIFEELNQVLSLIYTYASNSLKSQIDEYKLNILIEHSQTLTYDSLYMLIKQNFNNNWIEVNTMILNKSYSLSLDNNNLLMFQAYSIIKTFDLIQTNTNVLSKINNYYKFLLSQSDFSNLKKLVEIMKNNSRKIMDVVLNDTRDDVLNYLVMNVDIISEYFSIFSNDASYVTSILQDLLIKKNDSYSLLVDQYHKLSIKEPELTKKIELSAQNSNLMNFFDKVKILNFESLSNVTYKDLKEIYNTYLNLYRNGMFESDSIHKLFLKKCEEYFVNLNGKDLIREIKTFFNELYKQNKEDYDFLNLLNNKFFKGTTFVDFEEALDTSSFLNEFKSCVVSNRLVLSRKIDLYEEGMKYKRQSALNGHYRKEAMGNIIKSIAHIRVSPFGQFYYQSPTNEQDNRYNNYYQQRFSGNQVNQNYVDNRYSNTVYYGNNVEQNKIIHQPIPLFIEGLDSTELAEDYLECFGKTLALMCISILEYEDQREGIYKVFGYVFKPFYNTSNFKKIFVEALIEEFDRLEKGISVMFDYCFSDEVFSNQVSDILISFLENINKKQFKSITSVLEKKVKYSSKYQKFIDDFNDKHKKSLSAIFSSIFGKK